MLQSVLGEACPETPPGCRPARWPRACVRSPVTRASYVGRGDPAGPSSATPDIGRTRSRAHGLTDALRDAELLARAVLASTSGEVGEAEAFDRYQLTRDQLSMPLFRITDEIAAQRWTDATIGELLIQLSAAMAR